MATKRPAGSRSEVVRCPNCGEDYSVTYKRCPFCDEKNLPQEEYYDEPDDEYSEGEDDDEERPRKAGKRVVGGARRGGGYGGGGFGVLRVLGTILSLGLIVAAVWIVFNVISPMVGRSNIEPTPDVLPTPTPVATPTTPATGEPTDTDAPIVIPGVTDEPIATPTVTPPVSSATPNGSLKLSREDFTMQSVGETYTFKATGASGVVTYKSDKPEVATVDAATGKVTAVSKGSANITATDEAGNVAKCIVRCNLPDGATASAQPTPSVSGSAKLSREDFTLGKVGETYKLTVSGASGTPVWNIGNTSVATISGDGTITAVGKGSTTVTCTVGGQTLTCIVRCSW